MKTRSIIIVIAGAFALVGGCSGRKEGERAGESEKGSQTMAASTSRPEHVDEALGSLAIGMSYSEVTRLLGPPDEDIGSGVFVLLYRSGGRKVTLAFDLQNRLVSAEGEYVDKDGRTVKLNLKAP
ncbi:MAG TPA: hypothetical protein VNA25_11955 [Phycisphaerae bacterium]|nr:hypothetical protein [Phycisphaerae bacterium]